MENIAIEFNVKIGSQLKKKLIEKNISQEELAKELNVSAPRISNVLDKLSNGSSITTSTLIKICKCLKIEVAELL